jgi:hypothetical protein
LLAGLFLLLALRGALAGAGWRWIALALTAACLAHVTDLGYRWRTVRRAPSSPPNSR